MDRAVLREKLHLSGIDSHAAALARRHGLGFEVTAFCQAVMLEDADARAAAEAEGAAFYEVGDCAAPRKIFDAIDEGFQLASSL